MWRVRASHLVALHAIVRNPQFCPPISRRREPHREKEGDKARASMTPIPNTGLKSSSLEARTLIFLFIRALYMFTESDSWGMNSLRGGTLLDYSSTTLTPPFFPGWMTEFFRQLPSIFLTNCNSHTFALSLSKGELGIWATTCQSLSGAELHHPYPPLYRVQTCERKR